MKAGTREAANLVNSEVRNVIPTGKRPFAKKRRVKVGLRDLIGYPVGSKHFLAKSLGIMKVPNDTVTHIVGLKKGGMHGIPVYYGHRIVSKRSAKVQGAMGYLSRKGKFKKGGMVTGYVPPLHYMDTAMSRNLDRITAIMKLRIVQALEHGVFSKGKVFAK